MPKPEEVAKEILKIYLDRQRQAANGPKQPDKGNKAPEPVPEKKVPQNRIIG